MMMKTKEDTVMELKPHANAGKVAEITKDREDVVVKLQRYAKPNCDKCFGRGYTGVNKDKNIFQTCKCADKKRHRERREQRKMQERSDAWNREHGTEKQVDKNIVDHNTANEDVVLLAKNATGGVDVVKD